MNHDAHTLREFDAALTSLNTYLLQMAYKAQSALDLAVAGLLQQDEDPANQAIADATVEAESLGIKGKDTTPFLLDKIQKLTEGKSLEANIQLVFNNVKLGAQIASELCKL